MEQFTSLAQQVAAHLTFLKAQGFELKKLQFDRIIRYRPDDQPATKKAYRTWCNRGVDEVELVTKVRDEAGEWLPIELRTKSPR